MTKFIFSPDQHFGYERKSGHKVPLHDPKAIDVMLKFASDFKPDVFILGGDTLDCGAVSHHNKLKPGNVEGLRLKGDAEECRSTLISPLEKVAKKLIYMIGNHEDWLADLTIEIPALEGIVDVQSLLKLNKWDVIAQGGKYVLGKMVFRHGDKLKGGEHIAKAAVINEEKSIRFGHHHTHQLYTKTVADEYRNGKTGMAVGCLCTKGPKYNEGAANRWSQGFLYGYVREGGFFNDYHVTIIDGRADINGKVYKS